MMKRELAEILQKEMRDPRLALVTITSVEVARDFSVAKVFVSSVLGDDAEKAAGIKALQGAAGYLRGILGRTMDLRTVPVLVFRLDTGIEKGIRMYDLLAEEGRAMTANHDLAEATGAGKNAVYKGDDDDIAGGVPADTTASLVASASPNATDEDNELDGEDDDVLADEDEMADDEDDTFGEEDAVADEENAADDHAGRAKE